MEPPLPNPAYYLIPTAQMFLAEGIHAGRYLQARTTQDILSLDTNEATLAGCLTAQGKLEAILTIFCIAQQTKYMIISDGGESEKILAALVKFKVADQIEISPMTSKRLIHLYSSDTTWLQEIGDALSYDYLVPSHRGSPNGRDLIASPEDFAECCKKLELSTTLLIEREITAHRIMGQRVNFPCDIPAGTFFLEANLPMAISTTKGCYVGQEAIEMALARGRPPRVIMPYETASTNITEGDELFLEGKEKVVGKIVSIGSLNGEESLVVFAKTRSDGTQMNLVTENGSLLHPLKAHE